MLFCSACGASFSTQAGDPSADVLIGRGKEADFYINDRRVSARHAYLSPIGPGEYLLTDLNSANGTAVGDPSNLIKTATIKVTDIIYIAGLRYEASAILTGRTKLPPGPDPPRSIVKQFTIGRSESSDLVLNHPSVSQNHATLSLDVNGAWRLTDASSKNGSFVDGRQIQKSLVTLKNNIRFGQYQTDLQSLLVLAQNSKPKGYYFHFKTLFWNHLSKYFALACLALTVVGLVQLMTEPSKKPETVQSKPPRKESSSPAKPRVEAPPPPEVSPPPVQPTPGLVAPGQKVPLPQAPVPLPATVIPSTPTTEAKEIAKNATVIISCRENTQNASREGTGFFIGHDLIFTNAHVAVNINNLCLINNHKLSLVKGQVIAFEHNINSLNDFAVIKLSPSPLAKALAFSPNFKNGDDVFLWGYPGLYNRASDPDNIFQSPEPVFQAGHINKVDKIYSGTIIFHSAQTFPGNSGGPLLNNRGLVVGVNTLGGIKTDALFRTLQYNIALSSQSIINFLRKNSIPFNQ